jgi:thiol-disulfide isomerase/thioredoxin
MDNAKQINFNSIEGGGFLSKLQNAGSNLNGATTMIILSIVFFAIVATIYYFYYLAPQVKAKYQPNSEFNVESGGNNAELLFFYADWCPHCKTAKPIWNDLQSEYENKTINGYTVVFTEVNCSEETAEVDNMMNKYSVEGYPTIKLLKDGQIIEYDAKPSKETLTQFLNTVL